MRMRRNIGSLRDNRVNRTTLARYNLALSQFFDWILLVDLQEARSYEELDWQAGHYLEHLWEEGESKGRAGDTLSAIQHILLTRRILPGARSLFGSWSTYPERFLI